MQKKYGFTLIELSIVLVIIGLIVGGVLVGRDLIASAQIRAQVSQFEKFNQAVNTFRGKYNCLPGDCSNITSYLSNVSNYSCPYGGGCGNGDGDGIMSETINAGLPNTTGFPYEVMGEPLAFWTHMYVAGLMECCGSLSTNITIGTSFPRDKVNGFGTSVATMQGKNGYFWGITTNTVFSGNYYDYYKLTGETAGVVSPAIAQKIDAKIDDGLATTGSVYTAYFSNGDNHVHPLTGRAGLNCLSSATPANYDPTTTTAACTLWINMN